MLYLESQVRRNVIYVKRTITNELCKSLDGAFCVLVQLNNSYIEKEMVSSIMNQIPISATKLSKSKLLPYDETLTECLGTETKVNKIKCKLCEKLLVIRQKNEKAYRVSHLNR